MLLAANIPDRSNIKTFQPSPSLTIDHFARSRVHHIQNEVDKLHRTELQLFPSRSQRAKSFHLINFRNFHTQFLLDHMLLEFHSAAGSGSFGVSKTAHRLHEFCHTPGVRMWLDDLATRYFQIAGLILSIVPAWQGRVGKCLWNKKYPEKHHYLARSYIKDRLNTKALPHLPLVPSFLDWFATSAFL